MPEQRRAISAGRVIVADLIKGVILAAGVVVAIGPHFVAKLRGAPEEWAWVAFAGGIGAALLIIVSLSRLVRDRLKVGTRWLEETYNLAKSRRDLTTDFKTLNPVETVLAWIFLTLSIAVLFVPVVPLVRLAYLHVEWIDSTIGAVVLLLPMLVIVPLFAASFRASAYAAVHLAALITGSPLR